MRQIPLSRLPLSDAARGAALRALDSGHYILGEECAAFEAELAAYVGMPHCVLSSSWTAAVHLLHIAQGLGAGDEILVPSHTAFPTIEPLIHLGARPVFIDIDRYYGIDPAALEAVIGPRTRGIIPVHLYGHPCDMDPIQLVAERHGLWMIEDCAQAHGARYRGRMAGAVADISAFSFYPSKNLGVPGDGGCVMVRDEGLARELRMLRDHGRRSKYVHEKVGFNLRFNEIQAAVGRVVLRELDALNAQRRAIARRYDERLGNLVLTPPEADWAEAVYHMYVIQVPDRDGLAAKLKADGIGTGVHYPVPNHRQPAVETRFGVQPALPATEAAVGRILSLPVHGRMTLEEADIVCDRIAAHLR